MTKKAFDLNGILFNGLNVDDVAMSVSVVPRLDPADYAKVRSLLIRLGGMWSIQDQVFYFKQSPQAKINRVLACGPRSINQFHLYPTPAAVWNEIEATEPLDSLYPRERSIRVLEPHIGTGALAEAFSDFAERRGVDFVLDAYEIDPLNVELCAGRWNVTQADFLKVSPEPIYDLIVMNPPFNGKEYIKHILHAQKFLNRMGRLVAVTPTGWTEYSAASELERSLYNKGVIAGAEYMKVENFFPSKTFAGVSVDTTLCVLDSQSEEQAYLGSDSAAEFAVMSFDLFVSNNQRLHNRRLRLSEKLEIARADDASELIRGFVEQALAAAMVEGVHINRTLVRHIIKDMLVDRGFHECVSKPVPVPVNLTEQTALCF